jgi:hypothetical protein
MSLIGALTQAAGKTAKKTAPFYSAVDEALANLKRNKGTGAEFFTELSKQAGVKKAELADRKLEQAFKAKGKMTKEEAQQVLKENPPPKLREKVYDESLGDEDAIRESVAQELFGTPYDEVYGGANRRRLSDEVDRRIEQNFGTKYGEYRTPDGENYREILLKLPPNRPNPKNYTDPARYDADMRSYNLTGKGDYHSSHWEDEPNVLAHMRVQDRTGPNGEKILHVEEIQSDWHQAGRKKGYQNEESIVKAKQAFTDYSKDARERMRQLMLKESETEMAPDRALRFVNQYVDGMDDSAVASFLNEKPTFNALYRASRDAGATGVPDAPFKKNWHELAMKRLLNYAADNGYDSIAITPGAEQAKRYDLSKFLNEVRFDPATGNLVGEDHAGKMVLAREKVTKENLSDYIGKEGAQKILESAPNEYGVHTLSGAGLEVGGEGMKGFYDKMLPDYLNTFGKSYGAQVEPLYIRGDKANDPRLAQQMGYTEEQFLNMSDPDFQEMTRKVGEKNQIPLHNFRITPEMRESIKQKGLPLYQQIGIPTAGAGAASQVPEEPEYGVGGAINSLAKTEALAKLAKMRQEMAPRAEAVKALISKDQNSYLRDVVPNSLTNAEIEAEIARMKARAEALQPEVKLADGGAINYDTVPDMNDGGRIIQGAPFKRGGKVNMTTNRDTMFLELSNKKLKRK